MAIATEFTGTLTALNGAGVVEISYMEADLESARKIMSAVTKQRADRENQDLHFQHIYVKKEQATLFQSGQGGWVRSGNGCTLEAAPGNPIRFKADLKTTVERGDIVYAADIELGSIAFDLGNATLVEDGEEILFENVSAVLYPGTYRKSIKGL